MHIAMTSFRLNHNDITKGGQAYPLSLVRVGTMIKATKDSFKRVYKKDGDFHYPTVLSNRVRIKDNLYFKACEITRSKERTEKQPKMSLVWAHREIIIPDMDELARKLSENGRKEVVFVRQEDGAGHHNDKTYVKFMEDEFDERGWINFRQPSQSPVLNTCDSCYLPLASKGVSREQGLSFGGRLMKGRGVI